MITANDHRIQDDHRIQYMQVAADSLNFAFPCVQTKGSLAKSMAEPIMGCNLAAEPGG